VTRQLAAAGRAVGIPVLDHVVVSRGGYASLADDIRIGNI
jgi:DNA repair protein RadC